jgi:hypothetical protein
MDSAVLTAPAHWDKLDWIYFEAGAQEVWIRGLDGKMEFYTPALSAASRLCPLFPGQL